MWNSASCGVKSLCTRRGKPIAIGQCPPPPSSFVWYPQSDALLRCHGIAGSRPVPAPFLTATSVELAKALCESKRCILCDWPPHSGRPPRVRYMRFQHKRSRTLLFGRPGTRQQHRGTSLWPKNTVNTTCWWAWILRRSGTSTVGRVNPRQTGTSSEKQGWLRSTECHLQLHCVRVAMEGPPIWHRIDSNKAEGLLSERRERRQPRSLFFCSSFGPGCASLASCMGIAEIAGAHCLHTTPPPAQARLRSRK